MKRFFYILFITVTVFFSFGFRGCEDLFCILTGVLNRAVGGDIASRTHYVDTDGNEIECDYCTCGYSQLSEYSFNDIDRYEGSNGTADKPGNSDMVIVGDTGTVFFSLDGGETWEDRSIPGVSTNFKSFDFLDYGLGDVQVVVCGEGGTMYKSTNSGGGWSWQQVNTITNRNLTSIIAMTIDLFIAVGDSGTLSRTRDGGQTWENKSVAQNRYFNRIFNGMPVSAFGYAWAVGNNAYILATTDYGNSWFPQYPLTFDTSMVHIYDIAFRNQNDGVLVGQGGLVNYTTNGGTTWLQDSYFSGLTSDDIISLVVRDENTATALVRGTNSDGMATTTMITVSSEPLAVDDNNNTIPSEYTLEQNYPNPFNPNTTIQFSIPEQSFVTLEIFNVLGEKITTLVLKELNAGTHKYEWSPGTQPGGIYFYKLSTNNFQQTKKLVLLK